jgi:hypothetical protein
MAMIRRVVAAVGSAAAFAALLLGLARFVILPWAEPFAVGLTVAAVVGVVAVTLWRRPATLRTALEVDQRLGGRDQISTAVELLGHSQRSTFEERQIQRAASWAEARDLAGFGSLLPNRTLIWLSAVAVAAAFALAIPASSADAKQAQREEIQDILDASAQELEAEAEDLADEELAERLREAAEELRRAEDLDDALNQLGDARQELARLDDPEALPLNTALRGLDERLRQEPIGEGDDAASQLEDLKDRLDSLSDTERAAAADQLTELADELGASAPGIADALADIANGLEGIGDPAEAIDGALQEIAEAGDRVARAGDLSDARGAVRDVQQNVADARNAQGQPGDGQGQGDGQGDGQGQGQGQGDGQGQGQGQGQGDGQGQGQGQGGGGGGSGQGADNPNPVDGGVGGPNNQGQGTGDNDVVRDPNRATVFDPLDFDRGDETRIDFNTADPSGEVQGSTQGEGLQNLPLVPFTDRYADYQLQALDALDRMSIPGSLQDIVRNYFTELAQ